MQFMGFSEEAQRLQLLVRLENMRHRPQMYACTVEGYLMQVWLLLELLGIEHGSLIKWAEELYSADRMAERLTREEAERMSASALKLVSL